MTLSALGCSWLRQAPLSSTVEWVPKSGLSGQPMIIGGKPLTLRYDLEMPGAPVFNEAFLGSIKCTMN